MKVENTLTFLLGQWSVHRSIMYEDHGLATFTGVGVFMVQPGIDASGRGLRVLYEENGYLRLGTFVGSARRRLNYFSDPTGGPVAISFSDGRPFIDLDLATGIWTARHHCAADVYDVSTTAVSLDWVEERWGVRGPTKCFDATTTMRRLQSQTSGSSPVQTGQAHAASAIR